MRDLVDKTGLPEGWIFNIIEGKYLEEVSKRRGASWIKSGRLVSIPMGFAVEPTDLQSLVSAEMLQKVEELEEELQVTKDDLGQYKCPHCGSELSSSGSFEIDEHNEGYFQNFGCGYSTEDGYTRNLCPADPYFPKLEDFELRLHQTKSGEWICYPLGKTPNAKKVDVGSCPGKTEEEARARVIKRYNYVARKSTDPTGFMW